jgi:exportin-T
MEYQAALPIVAVLPEAENPGEDLLAKATTGSQPFDTHIYLYESVGALISLIKDAEEQSRMLDAAFQPLILELGAAVQSKTGGSQPELQQVLQVHHVILAIGAIARGFPEPGEVAPVLAPSWLPAFEAPSQAVLQTLEAFKGYRIVRDAVRVQICCAVIELH